MAFVASAGGQLGPNRQQPYMKPAEQMWAQSQGMHMGGGRHGGHMGMQSGVPVQMPGGYMVPGMMPGMPMMGPGKTQPLLLYWLHNSRIFSR